MAKDHYVPAAFLGGFSSQTTGRRRKRLLSVACRDENEVVELPAADVAWEDDMYSLIGMESAGDASAEADEIDEADVDSADDQAEAGSIWDTVDPHWAGYERLLPDAIAALSQMPPWCTYPAELWLRVLVPFVAGLLVRGPDFHERHSTRIPDVDVFRSPGNSNSARLTELTRLLAPICAAQWTYVTFEDGAELITSDRGYAWVCDPWGETGIAVPVSPTAALIIAPRQERLVLRGSESSWLTQMSCNRQSDFDAHALNQAMARAAFSLIVGPRPDLVGRYVADLRATSPNFREPYSDAWPPSRVRRLHETEWHRLVHIASSVPLDDRKIPSSFPDFGDAVYRRGRWAPQMLFPVNYPAYGTGLFKFGRLVTIRLLSSSQANAVHAEALSIDPDSTEHVGWSTWGMINLGRPVSPTQ